MACKASRSNLTGLLSKLLLTAGRPAVEVLRPCYEAISAYRSTKDLRTAYEDREVVVVAGRLKGDPDSTEKQICPGEVPEDWPARISEWKRYRFPDFAPRPMPDIQTVEPLPHLGMDRVLYRLVEDVLQ